MDTHYDLIVIGSGVAGLSAGVYASRYRMKVLILGEEFGGETASAGTIENYPGVKSIDGFDLATLVKEQAAALGAAVRDAKVLGVERNDTEHCFTVRTVDAEFRGNTVLFAVGTERRRLSLPRERELTGKGVHYCITCDGPVYTGETIAIVGGGDASVKGANLAAEYARKIYLIVRGEEVRAEPVNLERMKKLGDKIEVLTQTQVREIVGADRLERVVLSRPLRGSTDLAVKGLFVEIGSVPDVSLALPLGVALDERGYIKVDNLMQTNVDGVFAAGDAVNHFGQFKQDITAAALGAVAATSAYGDHKTHGELCELHSLPPARVPSG